MRLLLLIPALSLMACPVNQGEFFDDPDPEPTAPPDPDEPGEDARMGWVQLERSWDVGGGATLRAVASFHSPVEYDVGPTESVGLGECVGGETDAGDWDIPASDLDVGTPVLHLGDEELELAFDGTHWSRQLSTSYWEQHQEFTFRLTGGPDVPANFFEAVVGTPATLTLDDFTEMADGLQLAWTGANNDADIRVLISGDGDPFPWVYCRFADDGAATIPWPELEGPLGEGEYTVEVRRQRTVDFELGDWPGTTMGASSAFGTVSVTEPQR